MDTVISWLKLIFLEKHEIVYNFIMIVVAAMVFVLISWLRKAYRVLEHSGLDEADPELLSKTQNVTSNLNRKMDTLSSDLTRSDTQITLLQRNFEEIKKQMENMENPDEKIEEILAKTQGNNKELLANLNKRIEDLYEKIHRFNEQLINNQKQSEELNKNFQKVQSELKEVPGTAKPAELEKIMEKLTRTGEEVRQANTDLEHLHNKILEHEDQLNDLKRIFEDIDATFAEMNKRFQKIEVVVQDR